MWFLSRAVKYQLNTRGAIKRKQRRMVSRGQLVVSAIGVKWIGGIFNGKACHPAHENIIFLSNCLLYTLLGSSLCFSEYLNLILKS